MRTDWFKICAMFYPLAGMAQVTEETTIDMSQWLNLTDVATYWYFSANGLIWPKPGKDQEVCSWCMDLQNVFLEFGQYALSE